MRPIKLTMTAFGPYSKVEVIDFEELKERNLFLVTGPTGSGKTTVFDAISYALYGKASGDLRTEENLRSHFSDPELLTEVHLTFELKGLTYHVHRIPKQLRPKAKGEGFTEEKPKATLSIMDGQRNTSFAGITAVNKKIEEILGINEEQFKQIMMIPQGEFRKLLTSDSQEREKVLQQLFDTYIYRRIQNELNDQAKSLGSEIKSKKVERDTLVTQLKPGDDAAFQQMIENEDKFIDGIITKTKELTSKDSEIVTGLSEAMKKLDKKIEETLKEKSRAIDDNRRIDQKAEVIKELKHQEQLAESMDEEQGRISMAEKAARLSGTEENILLRDKILRNKEENHKKLTVKVEGLATGLDKAKTAFDKERSVKAEEARHQLKVRLTEYKTHVDKVKKLDSMTKDLEDIRNKFKSVNVKIEDKTSKIQKLTDEVHVNQRELEDLKDIAVTLEKSTNRYEKEEARRSSFNKVMTQIQALVLMVESKNKKAAAVEEALELFEADRKKYKEGKYLFTSHQAAYLAKDLEPNTPCPVCGSSDHPKPAKLPEEAVMEADLEILEVKMQASEAKLRKAREALAVLVERVNNQKKTNKESMEEVFNKEAASILGTTLKEQTNVVSLTLKDLEKRLNEMKDEISRLSAKNKRHQFLEEAINKNNQAVELLSQETKVLEQQKMKLVTSITEKKTNLNHIHAEIPERLRNLEVLELLIHETELAVTKGEEELKGVREAFETATKQHIQTSTELAELTKNIAEEKATLANLEYYFTKQLVKSGFENMEAYSASKIEENELEALKEGQIEYQRKLDRLKISLNELEEKTEGLKKTDIEQFESRLSQHEKERQLMNDEQGLVKARIKDNDITLNRVVSINDQIKNKEVKYNVVGKLARIAQGNNPMMMTFERYVLAAFLEDILRAANTRLRQMTQGRYVLSRTSELQRKNKQSGLELEVFDNFTGRSRHVKTLSGGESFKASLSMALGLSDVVQSYAGGVRLDTMFIDEGFGTLDQESLDSAINCLIDLQKSGRLVGIISHVQELKERIDTRLEISTGNTGSESRFVLG